MCLASIIESYPGRGISPIIAFKKFKVIGNEIRSMFRRDGIVWKVGKERSAGSKRVKIRKYYGPDQFSYPSGFHAYEKKTVSWLGPTGVWARVQLRGVQTKGKQGAKVTYVARYCKILEIYDPTNLLDKKS